MRTVKEQEITALAPNANAAGNARKISSGGGFVSRKRSEDDSFYMGECKGSGKNNYVVSADYIDEEHPVFRCSCPSRQFPWLSCWREIASSRSLAEAPSMVIIVSPRRSSRPTRAAPLL